MMFESVLAKSSAPSGNKAGVVLSVAFFALVVLTIFILPGAQQAAATREVEVTLFTAAPPAPPPPPPPPPPPGGAGSQAQSPELKPTPKKRDKLLEPKPSEPQQPAEPQQPVEPTPVEPTPAVAPATAGESAGGVPGGQAGGVAGGVVGGTVGGTVGGVVGGHGAALPFGLGMTRPEQIAGEAPSYTREAIAARVEGKVLVRCVLSTKGVTEDCKIVKGVPILNEIVLDSLRASRFTPVMYQGRPETVQYLFTFNFKLP